MDESGQPGNVINLDDPWVLIQHLKEANQGLQRRLAALDQEKRQLASDMEFYGIIVGNVADLLAVIGPDGRRIWNNLSYIDTLGYKPEDIVASVSFEEIHPEDRPMVEEIFRETLETGIGHKIEYRMRHREGHWVWLESKARAVLDAEGKVRYLVLVARNVNERKQLESELAKAQRSESASQIAGKVSADFNDQLASLLGHLNMARRIAGPSSAILKHLNDATAEAEKAQKKVSELFSLSRSTVKVRKPFELKKVVRDAADRAVARGSMARVDFQTTPEAFLCEGAENVMVDAFEHLFRNAAESLGGRGVIVVNFLTENIDRHHPLARILQPGPHAIVVIRDQGGGIREEDMPKIFDPYFTTKEGHQGLGLPSALATFTEHHGTVQIRSNRGVGTEASVHLPLTQAAQKTATAAAPILVKKRAIIMDDEQFVRAFLTTALEQMGFDTAATADGDELLGVFRNACEMGVPYDLVITDLMVPGGRIEGQDLPPELRRMRADVRILAISGYAQHPAVINYHDYGFDAALPKPIRLDVLHKTIQKLLA
jgi:PAS domain S-box-containing protein